MKAERRGTEATLTAVPAQEAGVTASMLVAAIESVWSAIQVRHPDVPDVVVTLGAGSIGNARGYLKLGHFAADRWQVGEDTPRSELFIGGEGLARGATGVLGTLLHEAAHGMARVRGIQDTSRQGRYHNRKFKMLAEELGIQVAQDRIIGWSATTVPQAAVESYSAEVAELGAAIRMWRRSEGLPIGAPADPGTPGASPDGDDDNTVTRKPKNGLVMTCRCVPQRRIRVAATVAEHGPIMCGVCQSDFAEAEAESTAAH